MVRRQHALPIPHHKRYLLSIQPPEPDLAARLLTSFLFLLGFARHSYSLPAFHPSLSLNLCAGWVFSQTLTRGATMQFDVAPRVSKGTAGSPRRFEMQNTSTSRLRKRPCLRNDTQMK